MVQKIRPKLQPFLSIDLVRFLSLILLELSGPLFCRTPFVFSCSLLLSRSAISYFEEGSSNVFWMGTKQAKKLGNALDRARVHSELACPTEWPGALFLRLWIDSGALSVCFFYKLYI